MVSLQICPSTSIATSPCPEASLQILLVGSTCWNSTLMEYWLVVEPPLWKIWLRQLGWWNSQYIWKQKCSKPPTRDNIQTCMMDMHQGSSRPPKKSPNREINSQGWWLKLLRIDDRNSGKDWRFMSSNTEMLSNFFDCTCGKSCLGSLSTAQVLFLLFGFFVPKINTRKWAKWSFISRSCSKIVPELKLRCNP